MTNTQQLENELWEAADQLRANSKLTAAEYAMPVLGLIFLRHADNRFKAFLPEIEADIPAKVPAKQREALIKVGFQGKAAIYLPEQARFDRIASLPEGAKIGEVIDAAMDRIEADYEVLAGALPRGYAAFEPELLAGLVKIFDRPAIRAATGDVFGRIYEYFLNKFAMTGAQEGGEFFTPPSLVRTIVNFIEPDHGTSPNLEHEFKKPEHPFRVAIVCAIWLTGFDVKCLATMYLDKPMQGHTLMQAVARVNRVGGGKKHGLVIDYNGMLKSLRKAPATFAQGDRGGTGKGEGEEDTVRDDSAALAEYPQSLKQARDYLSGMGFDLDGLIAANGFVNQELLLTAV